MKISMKEALRLCAVFLQLENILLLLDDNNEVALTQEETNQAQKDLNFLLKCANLVVNEIASEYVHLKHYETFNTSNGHISYTDFAKPPVDIYAVNKKERACRFKLYPSELITEEGEVTVFYTYLPEKAELEDFLDFEEGKVNSRIIAYGIAAEYCVICGLYEEALLWDKRYKDCLFNSIKTLKTLKVKERKWC